MLFKARIAHRYRNRRSEPTLNPGVRPLSESGQDEQVQRPPIPNQGQVDHRLTQFILAINILDQIGLVDDIHQMQRFRDPPKHFPNADT